MKHGLPQRLCVLLIALFLTLVADRPGARALDRSDFDTTVKPGDDFFQYVNGAWLKNNPIPGDYGRWSAFSEVSERNLAALHDILDGLARQTEGLTDERRKLRDLYITATDEAALAKQGAGVLAEEWEQIAKVQNPDDLAALLADFHSRGLGFVFGLFVEQDEKQSTRYAAHLWQGRLPLPERDYYLGTTDDSKKIRAQYHEHVTKMLALLGDNPADAAAGADAVVRIETKLAEASRTPTALRDSEANYSKKTLAQLAALAPDLRWDNYFKTIGAAGISDVIVGQPEFLEKADALLKTVPIADWRTFLRWQLINATASYLSPAFEQEHFRFHEQVLRGVKQMPPRWKRAVQIIDREMGEALGKLFVEKHFPPAARDRMDDLVKNVAAAYKHRIETVDWMGPETKKQALAKLATMVCKIGYPAKWRDYSALEIKPDSFVRNALRARAFQARYYIAKLNQPVDRGEWGMTPPTVNAYYNGSMNEIVFPAGILQPPFFDLQADDAINYGAIGTVIGHEITHGFDDQGSRSDAEGNLRNWWTPEDRARFEARSAKLVKQFDDSVVIDNLHINGKLTLGENLADLGGLNIAYDAYLRSLNGKPAPVLGGLTGAQRFFLGFAISRRGHARDAEIRMRLRTDPHSPSRFRVLVPLSNVQAFYDAFDVKPGDKMYRRPEDRVEVW
jgi:putative endopeptidase